MLRHPIEYPWPQHGLSLRQINASDFAAQQSPAQMSWRATVIPPSSHTAPARRRSTLPLQMLVGLMLGLIVGLEWPSLGRKLQPIGTAFIQAIQMIVIPLIFSAVTLGVWRMGENARQLGRVAVIAFVWFYVASLFAVLVALGLNGVFHPGRRRQRGADRQRAAQSDAVGRLDAATCLT